MAPSKVLRKRDVPQFIVCNFVAQVTVEVKNTVLAEDTARELLKKQPDLIKLESMYRKQPAKYQRRDAHLS